MPSTYGADFTQAFTIGIGPIRGPNASDGKPIPYCTAFMSDTDGTVTVMPRNGPSSVVITVIKGYVIRLGLREVQAVSTSMNLLGFL